MSCGFGLSFFPNQYKSPTGLKRAGCPIRLKELNNARKPAPTKLKGAQVARENYIRRRVATIKQVKPCVPEDKKFKGQNCNDIYAYGPVFGIAKGPRYGGRNGKGCKSGGCYNVYYANGGSGSDIVQWKRLYGGSRTLFSTKACKYGCCGDVKKDGLNKGCYCYTLQVTSDVALKVGDVLWPAKGNNSPPIDVFDAIVTSVAGATATVRCKNEFSHMSQIINFTKSNTHLSVYRRDILNNWRTIGTVTNRTTVKQENC